MNLTVEYGDQVTDRTNRSQEVKSPDDYATALLNLTRGGRTVMRARNDRRYNVKLRQVMDAQVVETAGPYGTRVTCRLQIAILSDV